MNKPSIKSTRRRLPRLGEGRDFISELGLHAILSRLRRISERLMRDYTVVYDSLPMQFETRWFTIFYLLFTAKKPLLISEIADSLKITHPAVIQTVDGMIRHNLLQEVSDSSDRRARRLELSTRGLKVANQLLPVWSDFDSALQQFCSEIGIDLLDFFSRIEAAMEKKDLAQRVLEEIGRHHPECLKPNKSAEAGSRPLEKTQKKTGKKTLPPKL
jgi:DNA-binding MarR family transcriptional regulator